MISKKHQFIFVHIPKTGGNSIQSVLFKYTEDFPYIANPARHDGFNDFEVRRKASTLRKHSSLQEYYDFLGSADFDDYFKFTCVRNPWDRALSHFMYDQRVRLTKKGIVVTKETEIFDENRFIKFIEVIKPMPVFLKVRNTSEPFSSINFYLKFERLQDDFHLLLNKLQLEMEDLPHLNRSIHKSYREYYSDHAINKVEKIFKEEIVQFNLKF